MNTHKTRARVRALFAGILGMAVVLAAPAWLTACNANDPDEGPTIVVPATVDSVVFWPPTLRYARVGDSLTLKVMGLSRGYACASFVTEPAWTFSFDTADSYRFRPPLVQRPENPACAAVPGVDSIYKRVFSTSAGKKLYLLNPAFTATDSLLYVSGTAEIHAFTHLSSPANPQSVHGRFTFLDSTAAHPRRTVRMNAPATYEILQTAVFDRRGDTLAVRVRRLQAAALPDSLFPACAGPRAADSLDVVFNAHRFP